jgi:hypothetical protein
MNDKIDIAEKEGSVRKMGLLSRRLVVKKIPFLGSQEGDISVLAKLDETGGHQYKRRVRKYPGFSALESFLKTDRTKDGRKVEYSGFQMLQRAATSGAYNAQRFLHWLGKKREDPNLIADRQDEVKLPPLLREALGSKDYEKYQEPSDDRDGRVERMNPNGTDVGMPKKDYRIRFGIPPYENVLEFDEVKRLAGPRDKSAVVSAPRLLTNQSEDVITKDRSAGKQLTGPKVAALLPPPKPVQSRDEPSGRVFELVRKGRTAARKAAAEEAKKAALKTAKKAALKTDQKADQPR